MLVMVGGRGIDRAMFLAPSMYMLARCSPVVHDGETL